MGFVHMDGLDIGKRHEMVGMARAALHNISVKNDFTPKVFWYNVFHLLSGSKFYNDI
jgi:hypothetical protein